jgi:hypothetical protein
MIQQTPKLEKPRWRPRVRQDGTPATEETEAEAVQAAKQSGEKAPRKGPGHQQGQAGRQRRAGGPAAALSDDSLRAVLAGQEDVLNRG